jgi:metallopeptidase MepB
VGSDHDVKARRILTFISSQVYSADLFNHVFEQDPRNTKAGERYRRIILQPGGSRDPMEIMKSFLGREPTQDAFFRNISRAAEDTIHTAIG